MMTRFSDTAFETEDEVKKLKVTTEKKLIRFVDIIIKEFKYLSKLHKDDILYTLGYHDKLGKQLSRAGDGDVINDIMSIGSMPDFEGVRRQMKRKKRPNSYHLFKSRARYLHQATIKSSSMQISALSSVKPGSKNDNPCS